DVEIGIVLFDCADDRRARRRVQFGWPDIRSARWILENCFSQSFVIAFPDDCQALSVWAPRIFTSEIDRHLVSLENFLTNFIRKRSALIDRDVFSGIDLNCVDGSNPGMMTVLLFHVDQLVSLSGSVQDGLFQDIWAPQKLNGQAIKIRVGLITDEL